MVKDILFEHLNIQVQTRFKNKGFKMKENMGLDTETFNGYVKLIADNEGNYKEIENVDSIISFLTNERFRTKFNWFFNIKYDFESFIKYFDYSQLVQLYSTGFLEYNGYEITYIDKKFFSIRHKKNNHYYHFYDLFGFVETSLQHASEKFLEESKFSDIVNSSKLNTDLDYWEENKENIIKYCIQDCILTKKIADYFWGLVDKNMKFVPKRPYSKGKVAEEYFSSRCYIPTINDIPKLALQLSYDAYSGGRFELLKRGFHEKVVCYDISSAYPKHISTLIDYSKGKWEKVTNNKISNNAYTGYYYCSVDVLEPYFSPVMQKVHSLSIYPNGKFNIYLSKWEYDFIKKEFPNVEIKIKKGIEFFEKEMIFPFKEEIEKLYAWKSKENDENIKYAVKIFLNSLYGKFIQVSPNGNMTGKLFNPIYASEITAKTRIQLLSLALQSPENIIYFSTDGLAVKDKELKVPSKTGMGDFAKDFEGSGVFVMSDVYNLWNEKKKKNRLRGFSFVSNKDIVKDKTKDNEILLIDILDSMDDSTTYSYFTKRPYHLGECLTHHKKRTKEDINIFSSVEKSIDINGDKKRMWERNFKNGKDALKNNISSTPIMI